MLVTRQGAKSEANDADSLLFARRDDGTLEMIGYALRGDSHVQFLQGRGGIGGARSRQCRS
jgi:hypothetical protein